MHLFRILGTVLIAYLLTVPALAADDDKCGAGPGHDRWEIKTSVKAGANLDKGVHVNLPQLVNRPNFDMTAAEAEPFEKTFFPKQGSRPTQEGDVVSTVGWLNYVHCKDDDNDYHVQISATEGATGGCLIVEVPHPDFVSDPKLKEHVAKVRAFLRTTFYGKKMPTGKPKNSQQVEIVGQLFFDAYHLRGVESQGPGGGRGVKCLVHTLWEIHPITTIRLAP
jgi:hypothetical protein